MTFSRVKNGRDTLKRLFYKISFKSVFREKAAYVFYFFATVRLIVAVQSFQNKKLSHYLIVQLCV